MQVQNINSPSFGQIILRNNFEIRTSSRKVEQITRDTNDAKELIDLIIKCDYDNPMLMNRYNELVAEQENNPMNIYIDFFSAEGADGPDWFQRAKVGNRIFKQRTIYFPELEDPPSTIKFLERACKWANLLKFFGFKSNHIEKNSFKTLKLV